MKRFVTAIVLGTALLLVPAFTLAQSNQLNSGVSNQTNASAGVGQVTNPLGGINSICGLIKALLTGIIAIGIPIAVLFIVFAGFKFVLAMGNATKLAEARQNMMYTFIGIGIFLGAWLLATVIANTVNAIGSGSNQAAIISCN